jgi:hypothetical protein
VTNTNTKNRTGTRRARPAAAEAPVVIANAMEAAGRAQDGNPRWRFVVTVGAEVTFASNYQYKTEAAAIAAATRRGVVPATA